MTNKALGRGLSALIPEKDSTMGNTDVVLQIATSQIKTNKYQPRTIFNQEKLSDLVNSIREKGVVQPILVRKTAEGYELIAGERRLRAVKSLGVEKIPAIVKNVADVDMLEISLIENIQREDLNPIEEANALQRFVTDFNFTQEKIAQVLGKDRSTIANTLRLLGLPKKIQDFISRDAITAGHAKALLALPSEMEQMRVCTLIVKKGLSVRETESLASKRARGEKKQGAAKDQNVVDVEGRLQHILGTRVKISHGKKRGRILIEYYSGEDLNRILELITEKA